MREVSRAIADVTCPKHPFYHPVQVLLFGSISYLGTSWFLSSPPKNALSVTITAYAISQLTLPYFSALLSPHKDISLVPLVGQAVHLLFSFYGANLVCRLFGRSLSLKGVAAQMVLFLSAVAIIRLILRRFRKNITKTRL